MSSPLRHPISILTGELCERNANEQERMLFYSMGYPRGAIYYLVPPVSPSSLWNWYIQVQVGSMHIRYPLGDWIRDVRDIPFYCNLFKNY